MKSTPDLEYISVAETKARLSEKIKNTKTSAHIARKVRNQIRSSGVAYGGIAMAYPSFILSTPTSRL